MGFANVSGTNCFCGTQGKGHFSTSNPVFHVSLPRIWHSYLPKRLFRTDQRSVYLLSGCICKMGCVLLRFSNNLQRKSLVIER